MFKGIKLLVVFLIFLCSSSLYAQGVSSGDLKFLNLSSSEIPQDVYDFLVKIKKDINRGKGVDIYIDFLFSGTDVSSESFYLKDVLIPLIFKEPDISARQNYVVFLSELFFELELLVYKSVSLDDQYSLTVLDKLKKAEKFFLELTGNNAVRRSERLINSSDGFFKQIFYNDHGKIVGINEYYPNSVVKRRTTFTSIGSELLVSITDYYDNGQAKSKGAFLNSQKNGRFYEYDKNTGKVIRESNYVMGKQDGIFKSYNHGGRILYKESEYRNGRKLSEFIYRKDGSLEKAYAYDRGSLSVMESFNSSGVMTLLVNYKDKTVTRYDPVSGFPVLIADLQGNNFEWIETKLPGGEKIRSQILLFLSHHTNMSYERISSLSNMEIANISMEHIMLLLDEGNKQNKSYHIALSLVVIPGVLEFINKYSKDQEVKIAVNVLRSVTQSYNLERFSGNNRISTRDLVIKDASLKNKFNRVQRTLAQRVRIGR